MRAVYEEAKLNRRSKNQESYVISQGVSSTHQGGEHLKVDIKKLHHRDPP